MQVKLVGEGASQQLQITLPIEKKPSKNGKSTIIASTGGFKTTSVKMDGKDVWVSLNAGI